jgi:hypothetical protein
MGLEGNKSNSFSLETVEEAENRIENLAHSVEETPSPLESDVVSVEETESTSSAQAIESQRAAEQNEAAELLQKMHENASTKSEATVTKETILSPEQLRRQERRNELNTLAKSLDLSEDVRKDGYEGVRIDDLLLNEEAHDREKRENLMRRAVLTGGVGAIAGFGGMLAAVGTGATVLGYSGSTLAAMALGVGVVGIGGGALAIGGLGWAGMKAFHAVKEWRHRRALDKIEEKY